MKRAIAGRLLVALLMCLSGSAALFMTAHEAPLHVVRQVLCLFLATWIAMLTAFFIAAAGSIAYLTTRSSKWDCLGVSGAEASVVCATIGLIIGPLWIRSV